MMETLNRMEIMKPTRGGPMRMGKRTRNISVVVMMAVLLLIALGMFLVSTVTSVNLNAPANDVCLSTTVLVQKAR